MEITEASDVVATRTEGGGAPSMAYGV